MLVSVDCLLRLLVVVSLFCVNMGERLLSLSVLVLLVPLWCLAVLVVISVIDGCQCWLNGGASLLCLSTMLDVAGADPCCRYFV